MKKPANDNQFTLVGQWEITDQPVIHQEQVLRWIPIEKICYGEEDCLETFLDFYNSEDYQQHGHAVRLIDINNSNLYILGTNVAFNCLYLTEVDIEDEYENFMKIPLRQN